MFMAVCLAMRSARRRVVTTSQRKRTLSSSPAVVLSSSPSPLGEDPGHPPNRSPDEGDFVSDQEWDLRTGMHTLLDYNIFARDETHVRLHTGRAMDILQQTLTKFFKAGLVGTNYHLPLEIQSIIGGKGWKSDPQDSTSDNSFNIYDRGVRLEYTPPIALPSLFPRQLHIEGLPLYVASAFFLRHTMNALYTDLAVSLTKVQIHEPKTKQQKDTSFSEIKGKQTYGRQRSITLGHIVSGVGRLGLSSEAEWDVNSTYTFCPRTGLILLHTVNAIHPAPSETVYAAFQSALIGLGRIGGSKTGGKGALNVAREIERTPECEGVNAKERTQMEANQTCSTP